MKRMVNEVKKMWKYNKAVTVCMTVAIACTVVYAILGVYLLATGQYDSEYTNQSVKTIATLWWMK